MRTLIEDVIAVIEAIAPAGTLTLSPTALNAQNTPQTITEKVFSVTLQSQNSDKYRDKSPGGRMRYAHALTVALMCRTKPQNQMLGYTEALDLEELVTLAMLNQASLPTYRVFYDRSQRAITQTGEFVLIQIEFSIEQNISIT